MVSIFSPVVILILGACLSLSYDGVAANLMCYQCNSYVDNNPNCSDPVVLGNIAMETCDDNSVCTKVTYTTGNQNVTSRGCDPSSSTIDTCASINKTLSSHYSDLTKFTCSVCSTDHCNIATTFGLSLVALVTMLATKLV